MELPPRMDEEDWIRLNARLLICEIESHLIAIAFGISSIYDEQTLFIEGKWL